MSSLRNRVLEHVKHLPLTQQIAAKRKSKIAPVTVEGVSVPPSSIRLGGHNFSADRDFLDSARSEAKRLAQEFGADPSTRILEIGCGVGRLPIGLGAIGLRSSNYTGVDVDQGSVLWCRRNVDLDGAEFVHLNLANARYNPGGKEIDDRLRLPFEDGSTDVIYLYSVFSHMEGDDVQAYLNEFSRILGRDGRVFLTAFLEEGVEPVSVNPEGYGEFPGEWSGELHCVRFSRDYFQSMVDAAGLSILRLDQGQETDGQTGVYLGRQSDQA